MKILIVSTVPYKTNGISVVIQNLYASEVFSNEEITFVFPTDSDPNMIRRLLDLGYHVVFSESRASKPISYIKFLIKLMRSGKFDIVHVHGSSATNAIELWAAFRAKVPVRIMHCHANRNKYVLVHKLLKPVVNRLCTEKFACSDEAGRFLYGKSKFKVINNAFDVYRYTFDPQKRCEQRELLGLDDNTVVVGHVGVMNIPKNQSFLIKAFRLYHENHLDSVLLLIGDGETRNMIEEEVKRLELRDCVKFLGSRSNISELLNAMDCFVFPSLHEGLGIAPIEAQANGLPVISASDNVPAKIKINTNFCFMSLSDGEMAWAHKMHEIIKERDEYGTNNVRKAGFDISEERNKLHKAYRKLLDNKSNQG